MFDILIKNGIIIDGLENPAWLGDIGIIDDQIEMIESEIIGSAKVIIDAKGLIVCPGFIDSLAHSYFTLLVDNTFYSKITQGVTFEVQGETVGIAPIYGEAHRIIQPLLSKLKLLLDWNSLKDFESKVENKLGINIATKTPAGQLRACVKNPEDSTPLTKDEFNLLRLHLENSLNEGSFGIVFNLTEYPACYYTFKELIKICTIVKKYNSLASFHIRNEASNILNALDEVFEIAKISKVRIEILHLKVMGKTNWLLQKPVLDKIENARENGIDLSVNFYPYEACSLALQELLPTRAELSPKTISNKLSNDNYFRDLIITELISMDAQGIWDDVFLVNDHNSIKETAVQLEVSSWQYILDLLINAEDWIYCNCFFIDKNNIELISKVSWSTVCSDGSSRHPNYSQLNESPIHPRDYGAFPKIINWLVKDTKVLTLEKAISKMTWLNALKLNIHNRGRLVKGCKVS